jgi:hypothetical protein
LDPRPRMRRRDLDHSWPRRLGVQPLLPGA